MSVLKFCPEFASQFLIYMKCRHMSHLKQTTVNSPKIRKFFVGIFESGSQKLSLGRSSKLLKIDV